jgi:hypothetical protein
MGERGDTREWVCVTCKTKAWGTGSEPRGWQFVIDVGFGGGFCSQTCTDTFFADLESGRTEYVRPLLAERDALRARAAGLEAQTDGLKRRNQRLLRISGQLHWDNVSLRAAALATEPEKEQE